jgi:drug/metabolite transporter (DMT)-like permease
MLGAMKSERGVATLFALVTAILWGLSFISSKVSLEAVPPMTLGGLRFLIAIAALGLFYAVKVKKGTSRLPELRDLWRLGASGFLGTTLYFLFENNGLLFLPAGNAALVIGAIPVATLIVERFMKGTRFRLVQVLGIVMSSAGIVLLVWKSVADAAGDPDSVASPWGYLLMAGAAASWVGYNLLTEPLSPKYDRLTVTFWQSVAGFAGFVPFALAESGAWKPMDAVVWLNVLYLALLCSALGYLLYVSALQTLGPTIPSVFINLIPVISAIGGALLLGERQPPIAIAGGAVTVAGVYMATLGRKIELEPHG